MAQKPGSRRNSGPPGKAKRTGAAGSQPTIDLAVTRQVLEQMELALRVAGSSALAPSDRSRVVATIGHLSNHLPPAMPPLSGGSANLLRAAAATKELSGPVWVDRFPGSEDPDACAEPFRSALKQFLAALAAGGARVRISSTFRPSQRSYLMHWSWKIAKNIALPQDAEEMAGVAIEWVHRDAAGQPDVPKSRSAAIQMVTKFGIISQPALHSRHNEGRAIDMNVDWSGSLSIKNKDGSTRTITTTPRSGMNADLGSVGATYGVIKASFDNDPPHWSDDGH